MADSRYGDASLKAREYLSSKVTNRLNKNVTDYASRFIKLTKLIPNWETYLTAKQREAAKKYLKCFNAYDVDYQLRLTPGTTHQRLFGSTTSKGALGRLEATYKLLEQDGFFEEQKKKQEIVTRENKKVRVTQTTLDKVRELLKLVFELHNYKQYLTPAQAHKVEVFIINRDFNRAALACGITVKSYQQALIGDGGVLDILKKEQDKRTIKSWDEV